MPAVILTVGIVAASIALAGWGIGFMFDKAYLVSRIISEPVKDVTGTIREIAGSSAGKIAIAGGGLSLLAAGIAALIALSKGNK